MIEFGICFYNFNTFENDVGQWHKVYRGRDAPDYDMFEEASDAYEFIKDIQCGVLVFHCQKKEDLPNLVKLLKKTHKFVRKNKIKVFAINDIDDKKVTKIFRKLKIEDFLERNDLRPRTFKFKVDLWKRTLLKTVKQERQKKEKEEANNESDGTFDYSKSAKDHKIIAEKSLDLNADQWILKEKRDAKYILRNWNVKIMGPSPDVGKWEDTGKKDGKFHIWVWVIAPDVDELFSDLKGNWYFLGEKPEYLWNENRWLFKGGKIRLFFFGDEEKGIRFFTKEENLHLPENSSIALAKEPHILDTFEKHLGGERESAEDAQDVESEDNKLAGHLKGKGSTDHMDGDDLSGDVKEKEDLGGNYSGEVNEVAEESEEKDPEKGEWGTKDDTLKGSLDKSVPEHEKKKEEEKGVPSVAKDGKRPEEQGEGALSAKEKEARKAAAEEESEEGLEAALKDVGSRLNKEAKEEAARAEAEKARGKEGTAALREEGPTEEEKKREAHREQYEDLKGSGADSLADDEEGPDRLEGELAEAAEKRKGHYDSPEASGIPLEAEREKGKNAVDGTDDLGSDLRGTVEKKKEVPMHQRKTQSLAPDPEKKERKDSDGDDDWGESELRGLVEKDGPSGSADPKKKPIAADRSSDLRGLQEGGDELSSNPEGEIGDAEGKIAGHYKNKQTQKEAEAKRDGPERQAVAADESNDLKGRIGEAEAGKEGYYKNNQEAQEAAKKDAKKHENISERKEGHYKNPEAIQAEKRDDSPYGGVTDTEDIEGYYKPGHGQQEEDRGGHYDNKTNNLGGGKKKEHPSYETDDEVYQKKKLGYDIIDNDPDNDAEGLAAYTPSGESESYELNDSLEVLDENNNVVQLNLESATMEAVLFQKKEGEPNSSAKSIEVVFDDIFAKEVTLKAEPGEVEKEGHEYRVKLTMNYQQKQQDLILDLKLDEVAETDDQKELMIFQIIDYDEQKMEKFLAPQRERQKNIGTFVKLATGTE
jgi:hypothetical protein